MYLKYILFQHVLNKNVCYLISRLCNTMCHEIVTTKLQLKYYPILFIFPFQIYKLYN
jgi:hypothetical protein